MTEFGHRELLSLTRPLLPGDAIEARLEVGVGDHLVLENEAGEKVLFIGIDPDQSKVIFGREQSGQWLDRRELMVEGIVCGAVSAFRLELLPDFARILLNELELLVYPVMGSPPAVRAVCGKGNWIGLRTARTSASEALDSQATEIPAAAPVDLSDSRGVIGDISHLASRGFVVDRDLIFDLGMHEAQDTEYYLKKGFRVVAIDANPTMTQRAFSHFPAECKSGQLSILNLGIGAAADHIPFYVNTVRSEWSSFDRDVASRGHPVECIFVNTVTIRELLQTFGVPHFLKIDIENYDKFAVYGLAGIDPLPAFLSVENGTPDLFEPLVSFGYRGFKMINQAEVTKMTCPVPAREGKTVDHTFRFGSSGPFGEDTPGDWLRPMEMRDRLRGYWSRLESGEFDAATEGWFDLHARWEGQS